MKTELDTPETESERRAFPADLLRDEAAMRWAFEGALRVLDTLGRMRDVEFSKGPSSVSTDYYVVEPASLKSGGRIPELRYRVEIADGDVPAEVVIRVSPKLV